MICDYQTNKVYLAEGIKGYPKVAENLLRLLYDEEIEMEYLPYSKDKKHVWARDYMPIQLDEKRFVKYCYNPDYLDEYPDYIPPYEKMCRKLKLAGKDTRLVIDGGNVVKLRNRVIMTDKVFVENRPYTDQFIKRKLEENFECEVVFIPWDKAEMFGHADGMVRAIGENYVLMNNYADFDMQFRENLKALLTSKGFIVEELFYNRPRPSKYSWCYINFLQVGDRIFVPGVGLEEDYMALEQIQQYYPHSKVILVPGCQDLVRDGGALNCISWTIKDINISTLSTRHYQQV